MNKKDCENIGYILSRKQSLGELLEHMFELDPRIEPEYVGFSEVQGRSDKVDELALELVERYNGKDWSITKPGSLIKTYGKCLEEARKEIYGEDYHPGMFK